MTVSCGLLLHTAREKPPIKVLLVRPGGPFWAGKDIGAWSIPKGLPEPNEDPLDAAKREFAEETGLDPRPPFRELTPIVQKGGKRVRCWSFEAEECPVKPGASTFEIEWPPRSGKRASFPEVGGIGFFTLAEARSRILPAQLPLLDEIAGG